MTPIEAVRSRIVASPAVIALINNRVYPNRVPDGVEESDRYIVMQEIVTIPDNHLEGHSGLDRAMIQVSCISSNYDTAEQIRRAAQDAVTGSDDTTFHSLVVDKRALYYSEIKRNDLQFDVVAWMTNQ